MGRFMWMLLPSAEVCHARGPRRVYIPAPSRVRGRLHTARTTACYSLWYHVNGIVLFGWHYRLVLEFHVHKSFSFIGSFTGFSTHIVRYCLVVRILYTHSILATLSWSHTIHCKGNYVSKDRFIYTAAVQYSSTTHGGVNRLLRASLLGTRA